MILAACWVRCRLVSDCRRPSEWMGAGAGLVATVSHHWSKGRCDHAWPVAPNTNGTSNDSVLSNLELPIIWNYYSGLGYYILFFPNLVIYYMGVRFIDVCPIRSNIALRKEIVFYDIQMIPMMPFPRGNTECCQRNIYRNNEDDGCKLCINIVFRDKNV